MNKLLQVGDVFKSAKLASGQYDRWTKRPVGRGYYESEFNDPHRAESLWIVEEAEMCGGDTNPRDPWPDGWQVVARELNPDGSYDPLNHKTDFFQSGCFSGMIKPEDVEYIEHRVRVVTFVKESEFAF